MVFNVFFNIYFKKRKKEKKEVALYLINCSENKKLYIYIYILNMISNLSQKKYSFFFF